MRRGYAVSHTTDYGGEVLRNSLGGICILLTWFCFVYDFLFLLGAGEKGIIFVTILLQSMLDTVPTK